MHKKAPFMTALTLATVALPDIAFSGTNPTNFRGCQKPEAVGQDKHQHEQACLDAKLRAVTEAVSKNVTQPEQPATGNNNGEQHIASACVKAKPRCLLLPHAPWVMTERRPAMAATSPSVSRGCGALWMLTAPSILSGGCRAT